MILTITLNPAVDIGYQLDHLLIDTVNRVEVVSKTAGGKGLNVARVVRQLNEDIAASGFLGGQLGNFIRSEIKALGIKDFFVPIDGETRNCIAVIHEGKQTEILESGPIISPKESKAFIEKFTDFLQQVEMITISGSLPKGLTADFYLQLIEIANEHHKRVLLDVNGSLLQNILKNDQKPFLIKPNEEELAEFIGKDSVSKDQVQDILSSSMFHGIPWIIVTLGKDGAIIKHHSTFYEVNVPTIQVVNPVGSGDAVIAGFSVGLARKMADESLIKFGMAMGVLNALEEKTGSVNPENINEMIPQIDVQRMK